MTPSLCQRFRWGFFHDTTFLDEQVHYYSNEVIRPDQIVTIQCPRRYTARMYRLALAHFVKAFTDFDLSAATWILSWCEHCLTA